MARVMRLLGPFHVYVPIGVPIGAAPGVPFGRFAPDLGENLQAEAATRAGLGPAASVPALPGGGH